MRRESEYRYSKLATILRDQIQSGFIKPGEFLLSENELGKYYGISRTSVRRSLDQLLKEGLIHKRMGQGTIVSPDYVPQENSRKTLHILTTAPCSFTANAMPLLIESFQRRYAHVEVKILSFPGVGFWKSLHTCAELGLNPDLILVTDMQYAEVENWDAYEDLQPALGDSLRTLYPKMLQPFRKDGLLKAVPVTFSSVFLAYNPGLFLKYGVDLPAPGWSREDFVRAAQKLTVDTDGDGIVDQYGFGHSTYPSRWPVMALQHGVAFDRPDRPALASSLNFMHDLLFRYKISTLYQSQGLRINSAAFASQKTAMVLTTAIEIAAWRNERMDFEPRVASLPFGPVGSTLLVSNNFMVPSASSDRDLALVFLEFALDADVQRQIARATQFLSVVRTVNEDIRPLAELDTLNVDKGKIDQNYFLHEIFSDPTVIDDLEEEMEMFWAGQESAAAFADRMIGLLSPFR